MTDHTQQFASDNYSGICPEAWAAMAEANRGHERAYGDDQWTARASDYFRQLFETDCEVFFAFNGTAANSLALAALCQSYHSVICSETAHVETDECGAPEFFSNGSKLLLAQTEVGKLTAIWAVQAALLLGILLVLASGFAAIRSRLAEGTRSAVAGSLLAAMNTASEYGFGAVIASLPGFLVLADALKSIPNPLVNEAITVTLLAGITGSASGGMSIALAAMSDTFIAAANAAQIPLEVLHRVAAMASGGMDTLPHNGAVITLLAVTGLTHREAYKDIFGITLIKTLAVFFVIGLFYATGLV